MIKAIETRYKGYRFRSRLEARWAVFFDALGLDWEYEKEGFNLGAYGNYLPDFWIHDWNTWVEIKHRNTTKDELIKPEIFRQYEKRIMILCGDPYPGDYSIYDIYFFKLKHIYDGQLFDCPGNCGGLSIVSRIYDESKFYFRHPNITTKCLFPEGGVGKEIILTRKHVLFAFDAARSARFEHGETPR